MNKYHDCVNLVILLLKINTECLKNIKNSYCIPNCDWSITYHFEIVAKHARKCNILQPQADFSNEAGLDF